MKHHYPSIVTSSLGKSVAIAILTDNITISPQPKVEELIIEIDKMIYKAEPNPFPQDLKPLPKFNQKKKRKQQRRKNK